MNELMLFENTTELVVGDCETLGRWDDAIILSAALTHGNLAKDYSLEELIEERTFFRKFDTFEQANLGRKSDKPTVDWWKSDKVSDEAKIVSYYPSKNDVSLSSFSDEYVRWAHSKIFEPKRVIHADRNLFDFKKLQHAIEVTYKKPGAEPWHYHNTIDLVSTFRAWGVGRYAGVDMRKLDGVVYHDPRYDAAVDWLRTRNSALQLGLFQPN